MCWQWCRFYSFEPKLIQFLYKQGLHQWPHMTYPTPYGSPCGLQLPDPTLTYIIGSCSKELHFHIPHRRSFVPLHWHANSYANLRPSHIFKRQMSWKNLVLHLSKYSTSDQFVFKLHATHMDDKLCIWTTINCDITVKLI